MGKKGKRHASRIGSGVTTVSHPFPVSLLHALNTLFHTEPISIVVDGVFWFFTLLIGCFYASCACPLLAFYQMILYITGMGNKSVLDEEKELAVIITGCDSGFGRAAVPALTSQGFVVFCGCLKKDSFRYYEDNERAIPLKLDVTSDEDFKEVFKTISGWLSVKNEKKSGGAKRSAMGGRKRYLHALINNSGIVGCGSPCDWKEVSEFKRIMEVNYFGTVRGVKSFLPIFKQQAIERTHCDARIINIISTAGFFAGGGFAGAYESSKHAVNAFTECLRMELRVFGVKVLGIYPSFHDTNMTHKETCLSGVDSIWADLTPARKEEYGQGMYSCWTSLL